MSDDQVKAAIEKAFDKVEDDMLTVAETGFRAGFPKTAYVGSCALVAIIHGNKLFVANAGDSKGIILRQNCENLEMVKVSKTFNANKDYE